MDRMFPTAICAIARSAIGRIVGVIRARRLTTATENGLLASPWMTTAGLVAVNLALVATLVGSPSAARAEQQFPRPLCDWCYEGWYKRFNQYGHATVEFRGSIMANYQNYFHRNDRVQVGTCRSAHPTSVCCAAPN